MFHTASSEQIKNGLVTDVYFERTEKILRARGIDREVRAEFVAKQFPAEWEWGVFAGLEECAEIFRSLPVDVRCMNEGTLFHPHEPVMEIRGKYLDFGRYETAILGLICQASGVATMAARCRKAAGNKNLVSFGARRMHPAIVPMLERNAFIGGCDGGSVGLGAELVGMEPVGTMPHALILLFEDTVEATRAFHEVIDPKVARVSLVDTFNDEKIEALKVAGAMGEELFGIRLDTPGSRRGDFVQIMKEVRWELDLRGYKNVKIFLSGGLDEYRIARYYPYADAFGIGTAVSNAPVMDFSMDIIEIDGEPLAKRGKMSGSKRLFRCDHCFETKIVPANKRGIICGCGKKMKEILIPQFKKGTVLRMHPKPVRIRKYVLKQLEKVCLDVGRK